MVINEDSVHIDIFLAQLYKRNSSKPMGFLGGHCFKQTYYRMDHHMRLLVIIACAQIPPINVHSDISIQARCLTFGLSLHLDPYFV